MTTDNFQLIMYAVGAVLIVVAIIMAIIKTSAKAQKIQKTMIDLEHQIANQNEINYNFNTEVIKQLMEINKNLSDRKS